MDALEVLLLLVIVKAVLFALFDQLIELVIRGEDE